MTARLDTSGLECPVPLLMAKRRLRTLGAGDTLVVVATDPDAPVDFGAWAAVEGHGLSRRDRGDRIELTVVKG